MNKTFASALTITLAALATCAYAAQNVEPDDCLLYTSPSPRD